MGVPPEIAAARRMCMAMRYSPAECGCGTVRGINDPCRTAVAAVARVAEGHPAEDLEALREAALRRTGWTALADHLAQQRAGRAA